MKPHHFNKGMILSFSLVTLGLLAFSFSTKFGLDSFEIYLNNKIMLQQTVNQPVNLRVLQLSEANKSDELKIIYRHCTRKGAGSNRTITLKDEKGTILKKWEFANTAGPDLSMHIAVKELLAFEKASNNSELNLYYAAQELPAGAMLSTLHFR